MLLRTLVAIHYQQRFVFKVLDTDLGSVGEPMTTRHEQAERSYWLQREYLQPGGRPFRDPAV